MSTHVMTPLLPEYTRCKPQLVSLKCENCKRWANHPEQTRGNGVVHVLDNKSKACFYIPISLQEKV
jgi:hypothetical protein